MTISIGGGSGPLALPPGPVGSAAHGFGDNTLLVTLNGGVESVLAQVTVTPSVTGKFRVSASIVFENANNAGLFVQLRLGHNTSPVQDDYAPSSVGVLVPANGGAAMGIQAEYGSGAIPTTFPLGTPVTLVVTGVPQGGAGTNITVPAHNAQFTVQELTN